MLTPAPVLTNKNCGGNRLLHLLPLALVLGLAGCTAPGPRALLEGEKLLHEGRVAAAVVKLKEATELLPKTAQAWNHLGLALHRQQQPDAAIRAYRKALALDHNLVVIRYNLGCLYLEQNNLAGAVDELTSYTLLQKSSLDGWLKLGSTYLRARRLDYAEMCFKRALELQPRHPDALNGLGVVQYHRRRWQDAGNHFNAVLTQNPGHAAALLNFAIVTQQGFNNRAAAVQKYRQYLALQPRPADADLVAAVARQIELELNPPPLVPVIARPVATNPVVTALAKAAPPTAPITRPASNPPAIAVVVPRVNPTPAPAVASPATSAPVLVITSAPPAVAPAPRPTPPVATNPIVVADRRPTEPARPPAVPPVIETPRPRPVEVTPVAEPIVVKTPQPLTLPPTKPVPVEPAVNSASLVPSPRAPVVTNEPKRSFFAKLNPFNSRAKPEAGPSQTNPAPPPTNSSATAPAPAPVIEAPVPPINRYTYLSPASPTPGNRAEAEPAFARGLQAQQAGQRAQALGAYQSAVKSDPAYFDAYYNLGVAALEAGDARLSLWANEIALALKPEYTDARHNLALALKTSGHYQDAADQWARVIRQTPGDARAHLALANLCAQQLRQPDQAREHYQKLLELNPRHPEAAKIRFWLAANP